MARRILSVSGCPDAELSVVIVDDEEIRSINSDYLERDRSTNVISFAMQEGEGAGIHPGLLGDVVISADTAARDALEAGLPFESELYFLLLHGILHLLGYDHERGTAEEARRMEAREEEIFAILRREFLGGDTGGA
ncbi:putative rRNA maturation factor YbeY [Desulfuromonas soudanensis]|uniref:Endoribonuclease YbeY n=1 Tax=Desulfuromonas soudanensis TaxID=1603606 RepID=A0A0M4D969_9BACT|nr:rRNA maturation RNase YbeY [Desulfuromonas soudanensis]ALC16430.1 putative rRNA maturation factor YbeY [Desulfuromonas soudanensis]